MMKKLMIYFGLMVGLVVGGLALPGDTAQAQEDLDTFLARSAASSFLITMARPELVSTMKFYALDSVDVDGLLAQAGTVSGHAIVRSGWVTPGLTFEVEAQLQPSGQMIVVTTGKHGGRWRVEAAELSATGSAAGAVSASVAAAAPAGPAPVSGNGSGRLVFQSRNGGDIYVINADGTNLQPVSRGIDPQLSPDGNRVAFTRWEDGWELYTVNVDGTNEVRWFTNKVKMKSPTWSPDGTKLLFSHRVFLDPGGLREYYPGTIIKRALRDGNTDPDLPTIPDNARGLRVDANGKIEFTIPPDAHWHLGQINVNTNEFEDIATGSSYNYAPNRHPSDPNIIFVRGDKGIFIHNTAIKSNQALSTDGNDRGPVAISADGSKIAVSYWQEGHWEIHTMNANGGNRQRLTETPLHVIADRVRDTVVYTEEGYRSLEVAFPNGQENPHWNNAAPVWSPDGSRIAFVTDRTGQWEIWIMNADGSNQRPMFPNGALDGLELDFAGVDERMISWR